VLICVISGNKPFANLSASGGAKHKIKFFLCVLAISWQPIFCEAKTPYRLFGKKTFAKLKKQKKAKKTK
jgi:ribonuclease I